MLVLGLLAAAVSLGTAVPAAREIHALASSGPMAGPEAQTAPTGQSQAAEPLSPFEYAINSVIGRRLNVPGVD